MAEILSTGKQRSGKNSRCQVGATNLTRTTWRVEDEGADLDTVNFESAGKGEGIYGVEECRWSMSGAWDAGANPYDATPGLYIRDDLATLRFYSNTTDNVRYSFTYARVRTATMGAEVRGLVTFESSGMSQGTYTRPTGSV